MHQADPRNVFASRHSRRAVLRKVGASLAVGTIGLAARPLAVIGFQSAIDQANATYAQMRTLYPWLPPCTMLDTEPDGSGNWYAEYNNALGRYQVSFPRSVPDQPNGRIEHESGHIMAYFVMNSRGPWWNTGSHRLYSEFLAYFNGDPTLVDDPMIHEIWAEHFARAHNSSYVPPNVGYPQLAGRVPFDAQMMKTFCASIAIGEDGVKYISGDIPITVDGNGNALVTEPISSPFTAGVPILGVAQRIGLAGSEASLPTCTFWATSTTSGLLMIRGDPVRNGTAWFRYAAFQ